MGQRMARFHAPTTFSNRFPSDVAQTSDVQQDEMVPHAENILEALTEGVAMVDDLDGRLVFSREPGPIFHKISAGARTSAVGGGSLR